MKSVQFFENVSTQGEYLNLNKSRTTDKITTDYNIITTIDRQFLVRLFLDFIHKIKKKIQLLQILSHGISNTEACITQDNNSF